MSAHVSLQLAALKFNLYNLEHTFVLIVHIRMDILVKYDEIIQRVYHIIELCDRDLPKKPM